MHIWMYIACIEAHIVTTMKNSYQDGQIHAYMVHLFNVNMWCIYTTETYIQWAAFSNINIYIHVYMYSQHAHI